MASPDKPRAEDPSHGGWSEPGEPASEEQAEPIDRPRYTLGAQLGRGGMGTVYAARDATLGRDVALKELQPELADSPSAIARLAREAALTSCLDHPGIVSVHDVGRLPDGRPFYTMRLVRGRTLARAVAEATSTEGRRQLVRHVLAAADAVGAAHAVGVVHRDLKPMNILVGAHGETQVVDWGLATPTPAASERWAHLPSSPARGAVGTHPYMAPEQARGEDPDPRHDVWSLGVTLAEVVGALPPDLAAIVARATAPAMEDRYPDASAFADDLLRWFEGRRVAAHTYTRGELLRRTLSAYRLPLAIGAAGLLAVAVAVAGGWWQTTRALDRALAAEAGARASLADLRLEQAVVATRSGARQTAERLALSVLREREDPLARGVFATFGRSDRPALLHKDSGPECPWSALPDAASWVVCGGAEGVSRWEDGRVSWTVAGAMRGGQVQGDTVLVWDAVGVTVALDAATGAERGRWPQVRVDWVPESLPRVVWTGESALDQTTPSGCAGRLSVAAVSGRGRVAALCTDGTLLLGTASAPQALRVNTEFLGDHVATALRWVTDDQLVAGSLRGRVAVFDGATGVLRSEGLTELGSITSIRGSPDGRTVALGGAVGGVALWQIDTSALLGEIPADRPRSFAFTHDGLRIHHGLSGALQTWRLPRGAPSILHGPAGLADVVTSRDGTRVATAGGDGGVVTVDLREGSARRIALGDDVVKAVAFSPTGGLLAAGMSSPFVAEDDPGHGWRALEGAGWLRRLAWLDDGSIVGAGLHGGLQRWEDARGSPARLVPERHFIDLERDGDVLVVVDSLGGIGRMVGADITSLATVVGARAAALRGERLAIATEDGIEVRDSIGARRLELASPLDVALSADGARVAAGSLDGSIRVWDAASGTLLGALPGHSERVVAVDFLPDGDLASGSWDKTARVWSLAALDRPVEELAAEVEGAWGPDAR